MEIKIDRYGIDSDGWYRSSRGNWCWYPEVIEELKKLKDEAEEEHF